MTEHEPPSSTNPSEIKALIARLKHGSLAQQDTLLIERLLRLLLTLIRVVEQKNTSSAPRKRVDRMFHHGTLYGVCSVARGTGIMARGRLMSEAPSTMWLASRLRLSELLARVLLWLRKKLLFEAS